MPRIARVVMPGYPHHITQRGNFGEDVFLDETDRANYLRFLRFYSHGYGMEVWAYCLMTNHVHLIAVPRRPNSFARTLSQAHMRYSQSLNSKLGRLGHVWQARFYSCLLDEARLPVAVRYVERNPVRAGLVERPWDYAWSSARARVEGRPDPVLTGDCPLVAQITDWRAFLDPDEDPHELQVLRDASRSGRPAGGKDFVERLERLLGRELFARPEGRPPKVQ